jgi:hypothetical protein
MTTFDISNFRVYNGTMSAYPMLRFSLTKLAVELSFYEGKGCSSIIFSRYHTL